MWLMHCRAEFMKQVLPRFWRPVRPSLESAAIFAGAVMLKSLMSFEIDAGVP